MSISFKVKKAFNSIVWICPFLLPSSQLLKQLQIVT